MSLSLVKELLVLHHAHTDIGYTHPQPMVWEIHQRNIDEAIELCEATAEFPVDARLRWTCEVTAPLLRWLDSSSDRQIGRYRALVKAGQISAGAMLYNGTPLSNAEQLARSLEPVKRLREELSLPMTVAINHDINGVPWPITQLLLDAGVKMLLMGINMHSGGFPLHRPTAFRWQGSDGRVLLAFNGEHYQAFDREAKLSVGTIEAMDEGLRTYLQRLEKEQYPHDFAFLTATHHAMGDNGMPSRKLAPLVRQWNAEGRLPRLRLVSPEALLERVTQLPEAQLPMHRGDWTDFWNFGCASTATETRIARQAKSRFFAAESLQTLAGHDSSTPVGCRRVELHQRALDHLQLFDEHTFTAWNSCWNPDVDLVANQTTHKSHVAHHASALSELLVRDALDAVAGNPVYAEGIQGMLVYNPSPLERTEYLSVPKAWVEGKWEQHASFTWRLRVMQEAIAFAEQIVVGPVTLPAMSCTTLKLDELKPAVPDASRCRAEKNAVESPYYRLTFDTTTGRITGLLDKRTNRTVIDVNSPWSFFGFVQETVSPEYVGKPMFRGRDAYYPEDWTKILSNQCCWNPDWPAVRTGTSKRLEARTELRSEGACLVLRFVAPGVESLQQEITLLADRPAIRLTAQMHKADVRDSEAIYFTFPLALEANWLAHYDTADMPVEFDGEQLPGAGRDFVTVGSWAAMHDAQQCVTLACPDAPLVQFGEFAWGQRRREIHRGERPLLLAWPVNNYWITNFRASQPGVLSFRYELTTSSMFDAAKAMRLGRAASDEVIVHPVVDLERVTANPIIVECSAPQIVVLHARQWAGSTQIMIRLVNTSESEVHTQLRLPGRGIERGGVGGTLLDPREEVIVINGVAEVSVPGRRILTILLMSRSIG